MAKKTYLTEWLAFLGEQPAALAGKYELSPAAIQLAATYGYRRSPWLEPLAEYLRVPLPLLLDRSPLDDDPVVRETRGRALSIAARRRLQNIDRRAQLIRAAKVRRAATAAQFQDAAD